MIRARAALRRGSGEAIADQLIERHALAANVS